MIIYLFIRVGEIPIERDDVLAGILPFFHIYGQVLTLLLTLREGGSVTTTKKFDFPKFLQMIQDEKVSLRGCFNVLNITTAQI